MVVTWLLRQPNPPCDRDLTPASTSRLPHCILRRLADRCSTTTTRSVPTCSAAL